MGRRHNRHFSKGHVRRVKQAHEQMLSIAHLRTAKQNHNEASPHINKNGHHYKVYR